MELAQSTLVDVDQLYREHRLRLIGLAALLVDDRASAEDVVQDAFIGLHRQAPRLADSRAALAYLRASVVNGARSALRRRRTVRRHLRSVQVDPAPSADVELLVDEQNREVLTAVRTLPARQQEVLVLRYWAGLSEAEIAEAMGVAPGTVKSAASRALSKLEHILGAAR